jgi:catechol 2,3-dioxygenase-like lactoylglutathione lyase family enzyme
MAWSCRFERTAEQVEGHAPVLSESLTAPLIGLEAIDRPTLLSRCCSFCHLEGHAIRTTPPGAIKTVPAHSWISYAFSSVPLIAQSPEARMTNEGQAIFVGERSGAKPRKEPMNASMGRFAAKPSHLIFHVSDTDETIAFYRAFLEASVSADHTFSAPSLDAIFGRPGVVIRSTFIDAAGYRLHTIETLDMPRRRVEIATDRSALGVTGVSFAVSDLDGLRQRAMLAGLGPTPMYDFKTELMDHTARMFFVRDPDGINLELVEYTE